MPVYRLNAILLGSLQSSHKDLLAFTRKKQCRSQTFTIPNNPENPPFLHHSLSHLSFTSWIFALKLLYKRLFFLTFSSPFFFLFFFFWKLFIYPYDRDIIHIEICNYALHLRILSYLWNAFFSFLLLTAFVVRSFPFSLVSFFFILIRSLSVRKRTF